LIEASKDNSVLSFFETNNVFKTLGVSFPPELLKLLRNRVKNGANEQAGTGAYELSQGGAFDDRALIEQRLTKLREEWSSRRDDLAAAPPGSPAASAKQLEIELMSDLRGSPIWELSDSDATQLALGCMSDQCRLYGEPRNKQAN